MSEKYPTMTPEDEVVLRASALEQIALKIRFIGEGVWIASEGRDPAAAQAEASSDPESSGESVTIISKEIK